MMDMVISDLTLPGRLLTTKEASLSLNVHENTLRRWSNEGKIKTYRIGMRGDRRFRENDIELIKEQMSENNGYFPDF
jgi:excisionase family DNA binding protein